MLTLEQAERMSNQEPESRLPTPAALAPCCSQGADLILNCSGPTSLYLNRLN